MTQAALARPDDNTLSQLEGQVALVTGAGSGIGRAVAIGLAAAGAAVAVNYLTNPKQAEAVVGTIAAAGGQAFAVQGDVAQDGAADAMVAAAAERFGGLDILVANAGVQHDAPFAEMTAEQWDAVLSVNLRGQFLCARAALRTFRVQGERRSQARGKIICMSSVHQAIPWAGHANYAASKGGIAMMMASLAQEVAGEGIRVNAIAPGAIRTPINEETWSEPEARRRLLKLIPYGRVGEPEDVARVAVWLASDLSDYVVGTTIHVDGGMMLYPGFRGNG
ncbi:glucose 1-dehydrogenase [Zavarzinia sp. CC-PAN008]|uniref:glucose 1-dehydrogenase n=1 Tax=Zavarzinia sp. CC-PAN008 TaxID=3243332 RepID=UPI003F7497A5